MTYTEEQIASHVSDYATHHEVATDAVVISRRFVGDEVVGFVLSLDDVGHSRGRDEKFGELESADDVTCCVCGDDASADDCRLVATDHGPDHVCRLCTYNGDPK